LLGLRIITEITIDGVQDPQPKVKTGILNENLLKNLIIVEKSVMKEDQQSDPQAPEEKVTQIEGQLKDHQVILIKDLPIFKEINILIRDP
jgi:hypothetical protein